MVRPQACCSQFFGVGWLNSIFPPPLPRIHLGLILIGVISLLAAQMEGQVITAPPPILTCLKLIRIIYIKTVSIPILLIITLIFIRIYKYLFKLDKKEIDKLSFTNLLFHIIIDLCIIALYFIFINKWLRFYCNVSYKFI